MVIEGLGKTVYHMGDTDIFGDMALIEELYAPKVGFVPIGDRFTMGAKAAALACKRYFKFDVVVPIHYGTFPIIDQDPAKFIAEMAGQNVVVPEIGKPFADLGHRAGRGGPPPPFRRPRFWACGWRRRRDRSFHLCAPVGRIKL